MRNTEIKLTEKETALLEAAREGMDEKNSGWLHEIAPESIPSTSLPGVVNGLVQKGAIISSLEQEPGLPDSYWIEVTDDWK